MTSFMKAKDFAIMRTPMICFESSYQNSKNVKANDILGSVSKHHHYITVLRTTLCPCPRYSAAYALFLSKRHLPINEGTTTKVLGQVARYIRTKKSAYFFFMLEITG